MSLRPRRTSIPPGEVEITAVRSQGAGGQNVNKVASAIHLRYDIRGSSLPAEHKARLLASQDQRITRSGVLVIKAQQHRTQELNRQEAWDRLQEAVDAVAEPPRLRKPTKTPFGEKVRRLADKRRRADIKLRRSGRDPDD
ncbi:alternative ribosome rescue aminoacyl-tRNA hydrolase ArfB [Ramlibacter humi]|uniref:Aminoacyl-tRNA hydrolase n=1 Tax=Ramlibacter humi TaxID=2530451 RepID=A0A4Z0CCW3_9BURK|nr:alternative ribosome rescue aminoacyl-tRNA hydrolase ArfB [Ramlibacter humi]TFZ08260.1 aminoacyl-tRNA hydrolase [Ramlibacter humi]